MFGSHASLRPELLRAFCMCMSCASRKKNVTESGSCVSLVSLGICRSSDSFVSLNHFRVEHLLDILELLLGTQNKKIWLRRSSRAAVTHFSSFVELHLGLLQSTILQAWLVKLLHVQGEVLGRTALLSWLTCLAYFTCMYHTPHCPTKSDHRYAIGYDESES